MYLAALCLSLLTGIALGVWKGAPWAGPLIVAAGLVTASALAARSQARGFAFALLLGAAAAMGLWRGSETRALSRSPSSLNERGSQRVVCRVASDPVERGLSVRFTCLASQVGEKRIEPAVSLLVVTRRVGLMHYGDLVSFESSLETPPSAGEFNYRAYLARQGISALAYAADVSTLERASFSWRGALYAFRKQALTRIGMVVPQPEAAFIGGVLAGSEEGMPASVREDLARAGLLHVLVISGFNFSLIAAGVLGLCRSRFGWRISLLAIVAVSAVYVVFTGADPPVLRAAIMAFLGVAAGAAGRPGDALTSLSVAATTMAWFSPNLLSSPSFQLSVATTAGVLWIGGQLTFSGDRCRFLAPAIGGIASTVGAQLASLPVSALHFGEMPLLGLLANAVVLPVQGALMLAAGVAAAVSMVSVQLGMIMAFPAWLLARYTLVVASLTARVPFASVGMGEWGPAAVAAYYLLLVVGIDLTSRRYCIRFVRAIKGRLRRRMASVSPVALTAFLAAAVWAVALQLPDGLLHVAFLDVGQGDAILITTPTGATVLVDGGRDPDVLLAHLGRALPFWERTLGAVVLTHPDVDHMGGLLGLPRRYVIARLIEPASSIDGSWQNVWREVRSVSGGALVARAGMRLSFSDGPSLAILYPPDGRCPSWATSDNDCSTVMLLTHGRATVLLTGDAEEPVERFLGDDGLARPATFLKVSHHGSGHGTTDGFLARVAPRLAIISVGDNQYGHPATAVLDRLESHGVAWIRTDQVGTVEIVTDGAQYAVNTGL